jgi:hypothetical protein
MTFLENKILPPLPFGENASGGISALSISLSPISLSLLSHSLSSLTLSPLSLSPSRPLSLTFYLPFLSLQGISNTREKENKRERKREGLLDP